jgi:hypothetical protein
MGPCFRRDDGVGKTRNPASPRRVTPELSMHPSPQEGVGNAGRPLHPQPRVGKIKPHERSHHGRAGITRHSRTRMVLTVSFALSLVTGLFCHHRLQDTTCQLDASVGTSGPHDFAVRGLHRSSCKRTRVHRIPRPTSVTIAKRPSFKGAGRRCLWI